MSDLNESETRKKFINPMLAAARWNIVSYNEKKELLYKVSTLKIFEDYLYLFPPP